MISIHALREESDTGLSVGDVNVMEFQSTLSVRRATVSQAHTIMCNGISIHALREESDSRLVRLARQHTNFNPRSP